MSAFTQGEIDASLPGIVLRNNPGGGSGADYTATCAILEDKNNIGYPLLWQSGDDEAAEGFEKHQIGVTCAPDERFAYIVCTEKTSYSLTPNTFSEVSDEVVVHRAFCAALCPTDADFTFVNPIKDITVPASPDTVLLQTVVLDELKTVKSTDTITVTHTQEFPCVFGICYKHKIKGEIDGGGDAPQPEPVSVEITVPNTDLIRFSAKELRNYLRAVVYIHSGTLSGIYLSTTDASKRLYRLRISYIHSAQGMFETIRDDIVVDSDNMRIGDRLDLWELFDTRMHYKTFERAELDFELTTEGLTEDLFLRLIYTNDYSNNG